MHIYTNHHSTIYKNQTVESSCSNTSVAAGNGSEAALCDANLIHGPGDATVGRSQLRSGSLIKGKRSLES